MIIEFYKDSSGKYRWRLKARNGLIMADCGESYSTYRKCIEAWRKIQWKLGFTDHNVRYRWSKEMQY